MNEELLGILKELDRINGADAIELMELSIDLFQRAKKVENQSFLDWLAYERLYAQEMMNFKEGGCSMGEAELRAKQGRNYSEKKIAEESHRQAGQICDFIKTIL